MPALDSFLSSFKLREIPPVDQYSDGFLTPVDSFLVPDAPQNLQLSLHKEVEAVIVAYWTPPNHTHGLIREYIVSFFQELVMCIEDFWVY